MTLQEILDLKKRSTIADGLELGGRFDLIPYPYRDVASKKVSPTIANVYSFHGSGGERHNVVISVRQCTTSREKDFRIWCSDIFLEGRVKKADMSAMERCSAAAEGLPNAGDVASRMHARYGTVMQSDSCEFWKLYRKKPCELCAHTQAALTAMFTEDVADQMVEALGELLGEGTTHSRAIPTQASRLEKYLFRVPVFIEGDRGSGKTTEAHAFASSRGFPLIKVAGHEGVEAVDLLGHYVQGLDRSMVWKDGRVAQAFRLAAGGQKVCLLIDELLRIPRRQLSVLLTAFSDINGEYQLSTGRIINVVDGVGEEEVLTCKKDHLAVVATTNVGAAYAIDDPDPALFERFIPLRKDTTPESLRRVLEPLVTARGFKETLVSSLVNFFEKSQELRRGGLIARTPTTRTLVRAVELADREQEVAEELRSQALLWIERDPDGFPVQEQLASLEKLIARVFK